MYNPIPKPQDLRINNKFWLLALFLSCILWVSCGGEPVSHTEAPAESLQQIEPQKEKDPKIYQTFVDQITLIKIQKTRIQTYLDKKQYAQALEGINNVQPELAKLPHLIQDTQDRTMFWQLLNWFEQAYKHAIFPITIDQLNEWAGKLQEKHEPNEYERLLPPIHHLLLETHQMLEWELPSSLISLQQRMKSLLPGLWIQLLQLYTHMIVNNLQQIQDLNPKQNPHYFPKVVQLRMKVEQALDIPDAYSIPSLRKTLLGIYHQIKRLEREIFFLHYYTEL